MPRGIINAHRQTLALAAAGLVALVLGTLVYLIDRDPVLVPFFAAVSLHGQVPPIFGIAGGFLPTFAHVFALSLLTAMCVECRRCSAPGVCAAWLAIGCAFETLQLPWLAGRVDGAIRADGLLWPFWEPLRNYAVRGTFDPLDVCSIVAGACMALVVIRLTDGYGDERQQ